VVWNFTLSDNSSINLVNYSNALSLIVEPQWPVGRLFLSDTPFKRLSINTRFIVNQTISGYDTSSVSPDSVQDRPAPCSNLTTDGRGLIDPADVQRCATTRTYRPTLNDTWITFAAPWTGKIPVVDINVGTMGRVVLPTSYESQYANLMFGLAGNISFSRAFGDQLRGLYVLQASKNFNSSTSAAVRDGETISNDPVTANYRVGQVVGNSADFYADPSKRGNGGLVPSHALLHIFGLDYSPKQFPDFSLSAMYISIASFAYEAKDCIIKLNGADYDVCAAANRVATVSNGVGTSPGGPTNDLQVFSVNASYTVRPDFILTGSWQNFSPLRMPNNQWRQPFISTDYNAFTSVGLSATYIFNAPETPGAFTGNRPN